VDASNPPAQRPPETCSPFSIPRLLMNQPPALHVVQLTPAGRGAVATVRIEGAGASARVDARFEGVARQPISELPPGRVAFGRFRLGPYVADEVLVCRPANDVVEIHCHGGPLVVERLVDALRAGGGQLVSWQAWVQRSCSSPIKAAACEALAGALTLRAASILLDQFHGALERAVEELRELVGQRRHPPAIGRLERLLAVAPCGLHLARPWRVALTGRANAGKSSLLNALVGFRRAIVHETPGTTRDVLTAATAIDGWPVEFADTAGLRPAATAVEADGIRLAEQRLQSADLVLLVVDAADRRGEDEVLLRRCSDALLVANKIDLAGCRPPPASQPVSALTGAGLENLLAAIAWRLAPTPPQPGEAVPFTEQQAQSLLDARNALAVNDSATALAGLGELLP